MEPNSIVRIHVITSLDEENNLNSTKVTTGSDLGPIYYRSSAHL